MSVHAGTWDIGSFPFHGPRPAWSRWTHDAAIAPDLSSVWFLATGFAAGAGEIAALRAGTAHTAVGLAHRRLATGGLRVRARGAVAFVLGRSVSPVCDPATLLQGHELWHVLQAVAMAAYAFAAIELWSGPDEMASRRAGDERVSSASDRIRAGARPEGG